MILKKWKLISRRIFIIFPLLFLISCNSKSVPEEEQQALQSEPADSQASVPEVVTDLEPPDAVSGSGQVYTVDPNGSDENDGSEAAPWQTIQHAVDDVAPGDTIVLNSGTYAGARIERSGTEEAWISLQAAPGANVLVSAPGPNNKHESNLEFETWEGEGIVAYWLVKGLEVAGAPNWGIDMRGSEEKHAHHFIISGNRVHDNGLAGEKTGMFTAFVDDILVEDNESYGNGEHGIYLSNSGDRFVVRGNRLHDNNNCGLHINGDLESGEDGIISDGLIENNIISKNGEGGCAGINFDGVTDVIARNNLLYENHASGIAIFQENGAVCSQNIQVLNNTIVQAEDGRWAIIINGDDCVNNKIFNNIILTAHEWRGSIVIPSSGIDGFESDYNVIMDRFSADDDNSVISLSEWQAFGYDVNSLVAAPGETFAGADDYHLRAASSAVDAGRSLQSVTVDLEGTSRPQGAGYDVGAFESSGGSSGQGQEPAAPAVTPYRLLR